MTVGELKEWLECVDDDTIILAAGSIDKTFWYELTADTIGFRQIPKKNRI